MFDLQTPSNFKVAKPPINVFSQGSQFNLETHSQAECSNSNCLDADKPKEECGVFGIFGSEVQDVASAAYYALYALQHRGQESCGIAVRQDNTLRVCADNGLVSEVLGPKRVASLGQGQSSVGHVRYAISAQAESINAQPIIINHFKGNFAISNNGTLTNYNELRHYLECEGTVLYTHTDAELIANLLIREWLTSPSPETALCKVMHRLEGAYSLLLMTENSLIAVRDPHGFRPLSLGKLDNCYVVASETCALENINANFMRDVQAGEIVVINAQGLTSITEHVGSRKPGLCVFEFVYFARPDSVIGTVSVHAARKQSGRFLAQDYAVAADVVIGVPDSGLDAALGYALESGIDYGLGFIKNKYIGRTFIQPSQSSREDAVRIKLNPIAEAVAGKRVVLVDDSIVRGTTCARIIKLMRQAGALEVHMRVSSPMFLHPCYFGTDIASKKNLIASEHTVDEIRQIIGADSLGFLSLDKVGKIAPPYQGSDFCMGCFTGEYPCKHPK